FFTTANPDVAKFFKRKFSCFRDDMKGLQLSRFRNNKTDITEKSFQYEFEDIDGEERKAS
ncbi:MAG: hypothetical protein ABEJ65_02145, partial [bacterium]